MTYMKVEWKECLDDYLNKNNLEVAEGRHNISRLWSNVPDETIKFKVNGHRFLLTKNNKPVRYVIMHYGLCLSQIKYLVESAEKHNLDLTMHGSGAWYNPGRTILIVFKVKNTK